MFSVTDNEQRMSEDKAEEENSEINELQAESYGNQDGETQPPSVNLISAVTKAKTLIAKEIKVIPTA